MGIILLIFLFLIGTFFGIRQKSFCNLITIFYYFWAIIVGLSNLKLFDMMEFSNRVYTIIFIGMIGTLIGYATKYYVRARKKKEIENNKYVKYNYNQFIIKLICIVCIVFYAFELINVLTMLKSGVSYYYIRRMYQGYEESSFFKTNIERYFSSYIAVPCAYTLSIYIIISLFKKEKNTKNLIFAIIAETLYLIVSASRMILIQILLCAVYMFFFLKKKLPKRTKKWIKRIAILLIFLIIILTSVRENRVNGETYDWGMFRSVYSYFSIPIPLLDYWIEYVDLNNYQSYGMAFFRAPLSIFTLLFLHPFGISFEKLNGTIDMINVVENFVQVFPRHEYNAFASMFYYFYMDFREIGVFLGGVTWGVICAKTYKLAKEKQDDKSFAILLIIFQAIIKTMVRWEFASPSFFVACILILFVFKKDDVNINEKY